MGRNHSVKPSFAIGLCRKYIRLDYFNTNYRAHAIKPKIEIEFLTRSVVIYKNQWKLRYTHKYDFVVWVTVQHSLVCSQQDVACTSTIRDGKLLLTT
ncbi:MAG TPA: hypothetical protein PKD72_15900, partial [Gemmatales bacterium]|nr:hypothetical protein [Gemmatales bacterium]